MDELISLDKRTGTQQHTIWHTTAEGYQQCGNVQIREVGIGEPSSSYGFFIHHDGEWKRAYCKTRRYDYSGLRAAKSGLNCCKSLVLEDGTALRHAARKGGL